MWYRVFFFDKMNRMDRIRNPVDPVKRNAFGLDAGGCTGSEAGSVLKHKGPTWTVAVRLLEQMGLVQYLPDHQRDWCSQDMAALSLYISAAAARP
jgi:hypothetical protein